MILTLDHIQRLNLLALLDVMEAPGRREAHAICKLQDLIELEPGEREAIELQQVNSSGAPAYTWNPQKTLPVREYDFAPADIERICKALDSARIVQARDGRWFRSLNAQLPEPAEPAKEVLNGAETSKAHAA